MVIDELHKSSEQFTADLVEFIKSCGNANTDAFKIVLLGTSSDASRLVLKDPGVDRLIEDLHLLAMDEPECANLIDDGMRSLGISIEAEAHAKLVKSCVGSPNILQYLCLVASEAAFRRTPRTLAIEDVDRAIEDYVVKRESRLYKIYMSAIETTGAKKNTENKYSEPCQSVKTNM